MLSKLFYLYIIFSKKFKILLLFSWLSLFIIVPEMRVNIFPEIKINQIIIESTTPMISQNVIEELITNPIESILSNKKFIKFYETIIESGRFKINLEVDNSQNSYSFLQILKREILLLEKKLPSEYSRINIYSNTQEDDPDLVFAFENDELSKSYLYSFLVNNIKNKIKIKEGVRQVKLYGEESYNYNFQYDSNKISLEKVNSSQILMNLSEMTRQTKSLEDNIYLEGWNPLKELKDKIYLNNNLLLNENEFLIKKNPTIISSIHRINSKELPVICIYTETIFTSIYLYIVLKYNFIFHSFDLPETTKIIPIYFSLYQNYIYLYENTLIINLLLLLILFKIIKNNGDSFYQFIKDFIYSFPLILIVIFYIDKTVDISILYTIQLSFLFFYIHALKSDYRVLKNTSTKMFFPLVIKIITNSSIVYCVVRLSKINEDLAIKIILEFIVFTISLIFLHINSKPIQTKFLYHRFISYKLFCFYFFLSNNSKVLGSFLEKKYSKDTTKVVHFFNRNKKLFKITPFSTFFILIIFSLVFIGNLFSFEFPTSNGDVIMGILEMPAGYNLSTTESISKKIESTLISSRKINLVYSNIQNEHVKYYLKINDNEEFSDYDLKEISKLAVPGYFYLPKYRKNRDEIELQFYGMNYSEIQDAIYLFSEKIREIEIESEVIFKFKPPFKNILLTPNFQKLSLANISPHSFVNNTKIQLSGGVISRIFENDKIMDLKLEDKNKTRDVNQWGNSFQAHNNMILFNKNYSSLLEVEEFSVYRKKNGKKMLSILLKNIKNKNNINTLIEDIEKNTNIVVQLLKTKMNDKLYLSLVLILLLL